MELNAKKKVTGTPAHQQYFGVVGQPLKLPAEIDVLYTDGSTGIEKVTWLLSGSETAAPGAYALSGITEDAASSNISASLLIYSDKDHVPAVADNWYLKAKYGLYVTFQHCTELWPGGYTINSDGSLPPTLADTLQNFDLAKFADDCQEMGVEYVNFTSYHGGMFVLWPSQVVKNNLKGRSTAALEGPQKDRDIVQELLTELHKRNIKLQLYIHATIGDTKFSLSAEDEAFWNEVWDDPTGYYKKWNDFINDFFEEMVQRYGDQMDAYYIDMITSPDYAKRIDVERLRRTLQKYNPGVVLTGNGASEIAMDYGSREDGFRTQMFCDHLDDKPAFLNQSVNCISETWFSCVATDKPSPVRFPADQLFRYMALTASANLYGGGLALGATPYADNGLVADGFEPGVKTTMVQLGKYLAPVAESIKGTYPSTSYITPSGMTIRKLPYGVAATRTPDNQYEYLHVLNAPDGDTLHLPAPLDGKVFCAAVLLPSGKAAAMTQDAAGVHIVLPEGEAWSSLDTVIKLTVAQVPEHPVLNEQVYTGPITATASAAEGVHTADCVIDGNPDTFWGVDAPFKTPDGVDKYVQLDLGSVQKVSALTITPRQDQLDRKTLQFHMGAYNIAVSENGSDFTMVKTGEMRQTVNPKKIPFIPIYARYIRVMVPPGWDFQYGDYTVYEDHAYASIGDLKVWICE